jgi:hypothetical protein
VGSIHNMGDILEEYIKVPKNLVIAPSEQKEEIEKKSKEKKLSSS